MTIAITQDRVKVVFHLHGHVSEARAKAEQKELQRRVEQFQPDRKWTLDDWLEQGETLGG